MQDQDWIQGEGGQGCFYFQASSGELRVEIEKRDLNVHAGKRPEIELRAVLFTPDRRVLHDRIIPDDKLPTGSGIGPAQRITLSTRIERPGRYGMLVLIVNDPNGEDASWRFRCNCQAISPSSAPWRIAPLHRTIYGDPGDRRQTSFRLCNDGEQALTLDVRLEFPGKNWDIAVENASAVIESKSEVVLPLRLTIPEEAETVYLRVQASGQAELSTYAALHVRPELARAAAPLRLPLQLTVFRHENQQLGYLPDYPVENQVYFDLDNRPFIRTSAGVKTVRDGKWIGSGALQNVSSPHAGPWTKIAFDRDGDIYLSDLTSEGYALLRSNDGGRSFTAHTLPGEHREAAPADGRLTGDLEKKVTEIEVFNGHNLLDGPPPVARFTRTQADTKKTWRKYGNLELLLPYKTDAGIEWEEPVPISDNSLGMSSHSGIPTTIASFGTRIVHLIWCEAIAPDADARMGTPAFAATYDRAARKLSKPVFAGIGRPANDVHNTPSIVSDSQGYLHILTGAHGSHFYYARSLEPNDTSSGFSVPVMLREFISQTYIGLVCDPDDTLHLVFREWRSRTRYFHNSNIAVLTYMRKRPHENWSEPKTLVTPPLSGYSVYSHRFTIDRKGRLFISYRYQSGYGAYQTAFPEHPRALMMSADQGETWKLVENTAELLGPPERR